MLTRIFTHYIGKGNIRWFTKNTNLLVCFVLLSILAILVVQYGRGLRVGDSRMFVTHDTSQPIRVQQFSLSLLQGKFPPRIAPEVSFRMGWPLFNVYAPTAYWITSLTHLVGNITIVDSLRISYFLAIVVAFFGTYFFLRRYFPWAPSLWGAALYMSSTYFSIDIFVRGALAEVWFIALLPMCFWIVHTLGNTIQRSEILEFICVLLIAVFVSTHNTLSFLSLPILFGFTFLQRHKIRVFGVLIAGLLLASAFWIPLILENRYTHAYTLSLLTNYKDHFLCLWQLWESPWGYGNSFAGCEDGMAFKVGKPQIIVLGVGIFLSVLRYVFIRVKRYRPTQAFELLFFSSISLLALFLTTYQSEFVWGLFPQITNLIQFPWRLISFSLIGIAYIGAWIATLLLKLLPRLSIVTMGAIFMSTIFLLFFQSKTFINDQNTMSTLQYTEQYLSSYAKNMNMSYAYFELLPSSVDFDTYQTYNPFRQPRLIPSFVNQGIYEPIDGGESVEDIHIITNDPFYRKVRFVPLRDEIFVNIHAYPNWLVGVNGKIRSSMDYFYNGQTDKLGRPRVKVIPGAPNEVTIEYSQTTVEKIANAVTVIVFIVSFCFMLFRIQKRHFRKTKKL